MIGLSLSCEANARSDSLQKECRRAVQIAFAHVCGCMSQILYFLRSSRTMHTIERRPIVRSCVGLNKENTERLTGVGYAPLLCAEVLEVLTFRSGAIKSLK